MLPTYSTSNGQKAFVFAGVVGKKKRGGGGIACLKNCRLALGGGIEKVKRTADFRQLKVPGQPMQMDRKSPSKRNNGAGARYFAGTIWRCREIILITEESAVGIVAGAGSRVGRDPSHK